VAVRVPKSDAGMPHDVSASGGIDGRSPVRTLGKWGVVRRVRHRMSAGMLRPGEAGGVGLRRILLIRLKW
jgi:hypothetical protein